MQKQFSSQCSQDKYSLCSKTGRKLYRRINNNIRVLNKSRISNKSNNSIGSVALRRTQLSNDKIYSRQQQFIPINSSQVADFSNLYQIQTPKRSIPMTPLQSSNDYRQRLKQSISQRSLRTDSQRSDRYRPNYKKINKQEIQKLLMLQGDKNTKVLLNDQTQRESLKRASREPSRSQKQSIRNSRNNEKKHDYNIIKPIRSIKSSLKQSLKSPSSKNFKQRKINQQHYAQSSNYEIKKLSQKYNNLYLSPNNKNKLQNDLYLEQKKTQKKYQKIGRALDSQNERNQQRNLQKYQSEKYLPSTQDSIYNEVRSSKRKKRTNVDPSSIGQEYQRYYTDKKRKDSKSRNYHKNSQNSVNPPNSLERYQKDSIARRMDRKNRISQNYQIIQQNTNNDYHDPYQNRNIDYNNDKYYKRNKYSENPKQIVKNRRNYQRSSILDIKSKHDRKNMKNIRIKQDEYGYLYEKQNQQYQNGSYSDRKRKDQIKYQKDRNKKQKYGKNHEYYRHLNTNYLANDSHFNQNQRKTQISQTFDSLILSINSRVTGLNSQTSLQSIINKVNLHLNTLNLIADYTHEFKKMYEQIEQWEQLIFMTFKKFWVERSKVLNFIKRFRKQKRHQSQRMRSSNSKKNLLGQKIATMKNIQSENYNNRQNENPFQDVQDMENPFIIPFCKVTQQEIKQLFKTQEGLFLIQKIQRQNQESYKSLQEMYNLIIQKSGNHINMLYCDNFSEDVYIYMLEEIQQLIPNLEQFSLFEVTKIRLGKIVKAGILILFLNGKHLKNIAQIITYDDCQKIGPKKKIKTFTTYDLYYEVFQKLVSQ